jgi:hypothetical protein
MILNLTFLLVSQLTPLEVCHKREGQEPTQCEVALVERLVPTTAKLVQMEIDNEALAMKMKALEESCKESIVITNDPLLPVWLQVGLGFAVGAGLGVGIGYLVH